MISEIIEYFLWLSSYATIIDFILLNIILFIIAFLLINLTPKS